MFETEVTIRNTDGLHMRPAMMFVDLANTFDCDITVTSGEMTIDAKSIMQMTMLGATHGTRLMIRAEGPDAEKAVESLKELLENRFEGDSAALSDKEG